MVVRGLPGKSDVGWHGQVLVNKKCSGGTQVVMQCINPDCTFSVTISKSRARATIGMWFIKDDSVCVHIPLCQTTSTPKLRAKAVETILKKDMLSAVPLRIHAENIQEMYGIKVALSTVCKAMQSVKGLHKSHQHEQLQVIGKFLQAFMEKNVDTTIRAEKDPQNGLFRIYICPGAHQKAVPACLGIVHSDAMHIKNKEFNFQIAASAVLTNQRSSFIHAVSIFPIENKDNWIWHFHCMDEGLMGAWLHSGKAMLMGDREKGEEAAAENVFPESVKGACSIHIKKDMLANKLHIRPENRHLLYKLMSVPTLLERDDWWGLLCRAEPRVADYLLNISPIKYQNSEQLAAGFMTHFTSTNNVAEGVGHTMCSKVLHDLPIRYRAPYQLVKGLLQLFCDRSMQIQERVKKLQKEEVLYSNYALSIFNEQELEAENYAAVMVGRGIWMVRRAGIITDTIRRVKAVQKDDGRLELDCECGLRRECDIMCRHEHCVAVLDQRFSALLEKPCGSIWHNENYIPAFKVFEVIMPTDGDIHACSGALFPGPWEMPKLVAQRGRPRVQRRKTAGEQFRKKQQARTGNGADDKRRQCSCCKAVGHTEARCPLKVRFIIKKPGRA